MKPNKTNLANKFGSKKKTAAFQFSIIETISNTSKSETKNTRKAQYKVHPNTVERTHKHLLLRTKGNNSIHYQPF